MSQNTGTETTDKIDDIYIIDQQETKTTAIPGFSYLAGFNIVSNYLWRGFSVGGLSLQPNFNVSYAGFYIGAWWNIGATDNQFLSFFPEVDAYIGFTNWGFTITLTHMHYFDGSRFFDFKQKDIYGGGNSNNTELHLQYRISDKIPLTIDWYTHIGSEDGYIVDKQGNFIARQIEKGTPADGYNIRRAYSSYFQIGYDFTLPLDIHLPIAIGMTPWRSRYTKYEKTFAVCCISMSLERSFKLPFCQLNIFARAMLNPDRLTADNIIVSMRQRGSTNNTTQHLNGTLGIGMWF